MTIKKNDLKVNYQNHYYSSDSLLAINKIDNKLQKLERKASVLLFKLDQIDRRKMAYRQARERVVCES